MDPDEDANAFVLLEILADGKQVGTCGRTYLTGEKLRDVKGNDYHVYDGGFGVFGVSCHVSHDDVKNVRVLSARMKLVATDGRKRLPASIMTVVAK